MDIITHFTKIFSLEMFMQGFVFTACFTLGIFMVVSDQQYYFSEEKSVKGYIIKLKVLILNYFEKITLKNLLTKFPSDDKVEDILSAKIRFIISINTIIIGIIITIFTIVFGVMITSISDAWMDSGNSHHFGIKSFWVRDEYRQIENLKYSYTETDKNIKLKIFEKVLSDVCFDVKKNTPDSIYVQRKLQIYYLAKHKIISDSKWKDYLMSTQSLINVLQSFSLSFFILLFLCYLNFFINVFRMFYKNKDSVLAIIYPFIIFSGFNILNILFNPYAGWVFILFPMLVQFIIVFFSVNIYYSLTSLILIYLSLTGYFVSSYSWQQNEESICAKTYGVYRVINLHLSKQMEEWIEGNLNYPKDTSAK